MTPAIDLLVDAYGRIGEIVHDAVDGLDADDLAYRPDDEANTVGWLVWHLARVQDAQVADVAGASQTWTAGGWAECFALPFDESATGYGQSPEDVAALAGRGPSSSSATSTPCRRRRSRTSPASTSPSSHAWWTRTGRRRSRWPPAS
ncbi:DinB superfamily protein [Clavibacter michiganensis]|uniref:DinB superfamily protein n=1 Tax=Clavibacter michiganensis TaxID=28447 RepID=A0A251Y5I5_9MICO|nr:DinB superfamily protein [Clavibacter michiganensis]